MILDTWAAAVEAQLRAGHTDVAGLSLALADWSAELRLLQKKKRRQAGARRREGIGLLGN